MVGKIKHFNPTRGFGFITDEDSMEEIFFHITDCLEQTIKTNDRVEFEIKDKTSKKGPRAYDVRKLMF